MGKLSEFDDGRVEIFYRVSLVPEKSEITGRDLDSTIPRWKGCWQAIAPPGELINFFRYNSSDGAARYSRLLAVEAVARR
jgi:hypothetical protein